MPLPVNAEPGAISGQQQQVQRQQSYNFSNAIPIKKRRFPIFRPSSPTPEESSIPDGISLSDGINRASPGNSDASKVSASIIKKEVTTSADAELGQSTVDVFASKSQEAKPIVSLGSKDDLGGQTKPTVSESLGVRINVKQETGGGQTVGTGTLDLSTGLMNVELSLGLKESLVPAFTHENREGVCQKSDQSDPSTLSLALNEEKLLLNDNNGSKKEIVGTRVCSNRSNWDLNTTMDVWEGSTGKTSTCHNEKSSLTTAGTSLNKRKNAVDDRASNSSNVFVQSNKQYKTDNSLGLGLGMAHRELDAIGEHTNFVSTSDGSKLNLQQVPSTMNVNRSVKSEPVEESSKRDCSVGSCNSSNTGLLKLSSVKRESVNNAGQETLLQLSIPPKKLVVSGSIKSELVQEDNQGAHKPKDTVLSQSVRVMQHQESCASSSALSVSLMPQSSSPTELTMSRDLSNQSEHSFHSKGLHVHNDIPDERIDGAVSKLAMQDSKQLKPCKIGSSSVVGPEKCKLARVDEDTIEPCEYGVVTANDEETINISAAEMLEEDSFDSGVKSKKNRAVDTSIDVGKNICGKQDEEYEDGEVREPIDYSAGKDSTVDVKKTKNSCALSGEQSDFKGKHSTMENHDKTQNNPNKESTSFNYEPDSECNYVQKLSDNLLDERIDEKRSISVTPDKLLDLSARKDVEESPGKQVSTEKPNNGSHGTGVEVGEGTTDKVAKEICSGENDPKVEASLNDHDAAKDSNSLSNKSRIINLSRALVVTSPCKTRSFPNRSLPSRSGKERCSDPEGDMQPRGSRNEFYNGGPNKFSKDRFHDQPFRNSRPNFMRGKGRSGRFGSVRNEWNSDHNFGSETSYGPSDYHAVRRKHTSETEHECNGFRSPQDGPSNRRKPLNNDEFPSLRRPSLRRVSPGDNRDGPMTRGIQMLRRFPRNTSPSRCNVEANSEAMGIRHMRHLPDDVIDPVYNRPQPSYDELDGQMVRGNRNFSSVQRKGYPRIRSKSPDRPRTRSPGMWSSPRRRSPNGPPEITQHRSPGMYRMGRIRSPDRSCFRDEMVERRRGSPSYVERHPNELRDVESGRERVHPRPANSNRRGGSPARVFPRNGRRADPGLVDSREMGDGEEYMNGPFRGDGSIDERRKFVERRGPMRSFRPNYNNDGDNFRFHMNDGPRPFRFVPDQDSEFVERSNMREREFDDGSIKHQPLVVNRRIRNIEEQQDGNYRPVERVWHDDEFTDDRMKRRRF
ncbi:hypothetical protein ACP275_06G068400 [Erythranthe tilingii]